VGPLGTAANSRPTVTAPGGYVDGEIDGMIGRRNRSTRRKPAAVPLCPPQTLMLPGLEPGPPRWEATTNRLSYGTALCLPGYQAEHTNRKIKMISQIYLWLTNLFICSFIY
jgi:hypothetical protein